ncbi:hypothetical protein BVY03_01215, partial [bacterium K02(2017)]
ITSSASQITIGGDATAEVNTIAYNASDGIEVNGTGVNYNDILRNSFHNNTGLGINLVSTGNASKTTPMIFKRATNGTNIDIIGTTEFENDVIQLFYSDSSNQEGETYISQGTADSGGTWTVAMPIPGQVCAYGLVVTATSTLDNTSEFSGVFGLTNAIPSDPSGLGPAAVVGGSNVADTTPDLAFTTFADSDGDQIQYRIQIDNDSTFPSPYIDYTSALGISGANTFTVGQAESGGTYTVGSAGDIMQHGDWYWRVMVLDQVAGTSAWVVANSGAVAFSTDGYTVTNTGDLGLNCDGTCSLREAIQAANAMGPAVTIKFDITSCYTGTCLITPFSDLPSLTSNNITIDGYS